MSTKLSPPETPGDASAIGQNIARPKPRRHWARWLGVGCLAIIVCLAASFLVLQASGVLSGPHGSSSETPAWSPDGSRIAFMSDRDGYSDIYVMNPDGSHVVQLTRDPFANLYFLRSPTDRDPAWSPDSKRIAFASGRSNGMMSYVNLDIYVMNADASEIVQVTTSASVDVTPAWSPDGKRIAYTRGSTFSNTGPVQNPTWEIYVMDADGSHDTQLTNNAFDDYGISWSPDSRRLAFVSNRDGPLDVYVMNADGSEVTRLTNGPASEGATAWSPDGKQIAFVSDRDGKPAIYLMNLDGSHVIRLTDPGNNASAPSWWPDGKHITFTSDRDGHDNIYVMDADGSNVTQLTGK